MAYESTLNRSMLITEGELAVLLDHIAGLESAVTEFQEQVAFLMADRRVAAGNTKPADIIDTLESLPAGYERG